MGNYTGPVLTYLALLGLILTTGVATLGSIKESLGTQLSRIAHSVTATKSSPTARHVDSLEELYQQLRIGETALENQTIADFSEEHLEGNHAGPDRRFLLNKYTTNLEHLGNKISDKLSGNTP